MQQPAALITGGAGTLAAALRSALTAAGWLVHAPDRVALDVTSASQVREYFARLPRLDLLINNAGLTRDELLCTQSPADRDAVFAVSLRGAFLCSRAAVQIMEPQRAGHIINIGSRSALTGPAGQTAYAAAKAGLAALTKSLAAELGPHNIRVNTILPGWLETPMTATVPPATRSRVLAAHALGRLNTPADAARFIVFLHSMTAVSGQSFSLDSRVAGA